MKSQKVTIRDIAEKINVSKTTVALALTDKYGVNEETKARIVLAAHEMGYNFAKIKNKAKNSNRIKLVVRDKKVITFDYWTDIIKGIEKECSESGYILEIFAFDINEPINQLFLELIKGTSIGLIFVDSFFDQDYTIFNDVEIPLVLVDPRNYVGANMSQVRSSNYTGGYTVGNYFWENGHRSFCFLGNIAFGNSVRMRYLGFLDSFRSRDDGSGRFFHLTGGVVGHPDWMHNGESLYDLFSAGERPTAIFCANDEVALYTMEFLKNKFGLTAPKDYSIVGYDNVDNSKTSEPPLTTINVDKEEIGRAAVRLLCNEIRKIHPQKQCVEIYGTLVERESTKALADRQDTTKYA